MTSSKETVDKNYHDKDVRVRTVAVSLAVLVVTVLLAAWGMRVWFVQYDDHHAKQQAPRSHWSEQSERPTKPILQINEPEDLKVHRAYEEALLRNVAWVNQADGVVRLPIKRAMELVIDEGLPVRDGGRRP